MQFKKKMKMSAKRKRKSQKFFQSTRFSISFLLVGDWCQDKWKLSNLHSRLDMVFYIMELLSVQLMVDLIMKYQLSVSQVSSTLNYQQLNLIMVKFLSMNHLQKNFSLKISVKYLLNSTSTCLQYLAQV